MRYILIDMYNLFFRVRHTASRHATIDDKLGLALQTILESANRVVHLLDIDHVVFTIDGHSWRKSFYTPYKNNRVLLRQARTDDEIEEDDLFFETLNNLTTFLTEHTNCSVIRAENGEADDVIARWITLHPNDEHIILSSDSDFYQLISEKVKQYNGITRELITLDGYYNDNNKPIIDKKTKKHKKLGDPQWLLFEKCMRGDKSDNVFSAYPGVRTKGTKNNTGLLEAYEDCNKKGFYWNNLMLQRWMDHNDKEHKVMDDYERNKKLIDLTQQPQHIKDEVDTAILDVLLLSPLTVLPANKVAFSFLKFCGRNDLQRLSKNPDNVVKWITKPYNGEILEYGKD